MKFILRFTIIVIAAALAAHVDCRGGIAASVIDLYSLEIGGRLQRIDATTGQLQQSFNLSPGNRHWRDIAATPIDPTGVYALSVSASTGARYFSRIDALTGTVADITLTNASGGTNPLSYGLHAITFDPRSPHLGYIGASAVTQSGVQVNRLARFNLTTRQIETSLNTTHRWSGLTMNPAGQLIGSVDFFDDSHGTNTNVYDIDPASGSSSLRFTVSSRDVTALVYHPEDQRLFAVDAHANDDLVVLEQTSGSITRIGDLPSGGPDGLAFTSIPGIFGDYNGDDGVDAADYIVWRKSLGTLVAHGAGADGNVNGIVDEIDYAVWLSNFESTQGGSGSTSNHSIPEPCFGSQLIILLAINAGLRHRSAV